jgi:hypothetical protein
MRYQCLDYALDKCHDDGGGVVFVRSMHWCIPHVQHLSRAGVLTHYVPHHDLPHAWMAPLGFDGQVITGDPDAAHREPMHPLCTGIGVVALALFGASWYVRRTVARVLRGLP